MGHFFYVSLLSFLLSHLLKTDVKCNVLSCSFCIACSMEAVKKRKHICSATLSIFFLLYSLTSSSKVSASVFFYWKKNYTYKYSPFSSFFFACDWKVLCRIGERMETKSKNIRTGLCRSWLLSSGVLNVGFLVTCTPAFPFFLDRHAPHSFPLLKTLSLIKEIRLEPFILRRQLLLQTRWSGSYVWKKLFWCVHFRETKVNVPVLFVCARISDENVLTKVGLALSQPLFISVSVRTSENIGTTTFQQSFA